jgi:hypothetical protein
MLGLLTCRAAALQPSSAAALRTRSACHSNHGAAVIIGQAKDCGRVVGCMRRVACCRSHVARRGYIACARRLIATCTATRALHND